MSGININIFIETKEEDTDKIWHLCNARKIADLISDTFINNGIKYNGTIRISAEQSNKMIYVK